MKRKKILAPSLMCADFRNLSGEMKKLEDGGIELFHIDIMDGVFVPNFAMGLHDVQAIRKLSGKTLDVHLMVVNPENHIELFLNQGIDRLSFHYEASDNPKQLLAAIRQSGAKAGIVINPDTPVSVLEGLLEDLDFVIVMTVFPGFAGQKFIEHTKDKVEELAKMIQRANLNIEIMVDGAISVERIIELSKLGADSFVLGTSALFNKGRPYKELIEDINQQIN